MPSKAQIHSVDALELFRVKLVQYLEKSITTMDEIGSDLKRTLIWLEEQQKPFWKHQVRLKRRALEETRNEIFGAKLSQMRHSSDAQQVALQRAKQAFEEAEEKLHRVKKWCRRYQSDVEPLGREVEKLQAVMFQDLKQGAALLDRIIRTLEDYADRRKSLDSDRSDMVEVLEGGTGLPDQRGIEVNKDLGESES